MWMQLPPTAVPGIDFLSGRPAAPHLMEHDVLLPGIAVEYGDVVGLRRPGPEAVVIGRFLEVLPAYADDSAAPGQDALKAPNAIVSGVQPGCPDQQKC